MIDYGSGNLRSVQKACERVGMRVKVTQSGEDIKSADRLILPGVGSFDDSMVTLEKLKLLSSIRSFIKSARPYLGICLGMQILFERSEEGRQVKGLGVFEGVVKKFMPAGGIKVPHMGWNRVARPSRPVDTSERLFKGIADGSFFYFCHSYYPEPKDDSISALTCSYGLDFAAMVCRGNTFGVQFHPEKSQELGLQVLRNFAEL